MDKNQMKQIIDQPLDPEHIREGTYFSMFSDFYTRNNRVVIFWVWGNALVFLTLLVVTAILFFLTNNTQYHILYAALFICSVQVIILTKIVYFLAVIRNRTLRDVKRLELCIAEMNETLKTKG
jgi:phosphatidylglycerophosphate synthase